MSRSTTPTYIVEVKTNDPAFGLTPFAWPTREMGGAPTNERLERFVEDYNASFAPGGVNEHVGPIRIRSAVAIRQADSHAIATYYRKEA